MKKSSEELRALLMKRFEEAEFRVSPQNDTELLALLPENQLKIGLVLSSIISDKTLDPIFRSWAGEYMIEYFAPPFFIKDELFRLMRRCSPPSPKMQPLVDEVVKALKDLESEPECAPLEPTSPLERALENIAKLAYYNPDCIKRWAWAVGGEKLTCSIGKEKLF